jgi:photosynthetic reaction center cytochrome c subunit
MGRLGNLILGLCLLIVISAIARPQAQSTAASLSGKTAEQVYKNIQVLKDVPADQVIPAMQFVAASLGVQCDFCHLENAFEKDDKETKQTARKMMRMMFAINKDNFDGKREVTCYACHRGAPKPIATPILSQEDLKFSDDYVHGAQPAASSLPTAEEVLGRYLQAIGGLEAAARISTRVQKGSLTVGTQHFALEIAAQAPAERVTTIHFPGGDSVTGINDQEGWLSTPGHPLRAMSPSEVDSARMEAELFFPAALKQIFKEFRLQQQGQLNGNEVYVLTASNENRSAAQLYFDQRSGLLVRVLRFVESPLGRNPTEIDYSDYREQDGLKIPFQWAISRPGAHFSIQIEEMKQNVAITKGTFVKPVETSTH